MSGQDSRCNRRSSGDHDVYLIFLVEIIFILAENTTWKADQCCIIFNNDEANVLMLTCIFAARCDELEVVALSSTFVGLGHASEPIVVKHRRAAR